MNKNNLAWLHLSDVHIPSIKSDTYKLDNVTEALLKTLTAESKNDCSPDIIFFTGDLADKGRDYSKVELFFDKLLDATGLSKKYGSEAKRYLLIVPGNHDVDREKTEFLMRTLSSRDEANKFFSLESKEIREIYFKRFHAYTEFFNRYFNGIREITVEKPFYTEEILFEEKQIRIGVLGLNSAWFSQDDKDEHKLWIGERLCKNAFDSLGDIDKFDVVFALHHHPYSWLHQEEERYLKGLLTNYVDICLFGHLHQFQTEEIKDQHGKVLRFQSGALYDKSPYPYRILWGNMQSGKVVIKPMTFQEGPPAYWTIDPSLFPYNAPNYSESFDLPRLKNNRFIEKSEKSLDPGKNDSNEQTEVSIISNLDEDIQLSSVEWGVRDSELVEFYFEQCAKYDDLYDSCLSWDERKLREYFTNHGLAGDDSQGKTFLTHAGVLLCCRRDSIPHYRYNTEIVLVDTNQLRHTFSGSILYLYNELLQKLTPFFKRRMGAPDERDESGGENVYFEYPEVALIEALVNFLIHRDYSLPDIGFITITPEKIEFINPGRSFFSATILLESEHPLRPQYKRNLRLITAMSKARLNQKEGSGILRIRESLESNFSYFADGTPGLLIENNQEENRFKLTIFNKLFLAAEASPGDIRQEIKINERQKENKFNDKFQEFAKERLIYEHPSMVRLVELVGRVAITDLTVTIEGESGTGKELISRLIHELSNRREKPFIYVNLATVPKELLQTELFGHEKGSFSGAVSQRRGLIEAADGGTIILDEINQLNLEHQPVLLRFLQERTFHRLGSIRELKADVRVIATSNQNLEKLTEDGRFRTDLYYRLNTIKIIVPPLRERKSDIPILIDYFIQKISKRWGKDLLIDKEVIEYLQKQSYPGNVRELINIIEYLAVISDNENITMEDFKQTEFFNAENE